MGFDYHFNQDHCYLEDCSNAEQIVSNVKISENSDRIETCNLSPKKQRNRIAHIFVKYEDKIKSSPRIGNQQTIYLPSEAICTKHTDLLLHEDQKLVKPGDKFKTHNDFVQYLNENAKRWFFYYKCSDSRKPNTEREMYLYNCVYLRNKEKYVKKGLRKRNTSLKTNCPCKIKLRHLPNENELTVVFVCNHHDHPLSEEAFYKLQHGRRLPPYIKEEIMDLLTLQVDIAKIRKYVQIATGFNMSRAFFYTLERRMKARKVERHVSDDRLENLSKRLNEKNIFDSVESKRCKPNYSKDVINVSGTLLSVKKLHESVKCETQQNPWITDQCVIIPANGDLTVINKKDNTSFDVENPIKQYNGGNFETISNNEIKCDANNTFTINEDSNMAYKTVIFNIDDSCEKDENVITEYVYDANHYDGLVEDIYSKNAIKEGINESNCDNEIIEYVNDNAEVVEHLADNQNECIDYYNKDKTNSNNDQCDEEIVMCEVDYDNDDYIEAKDVEVQTCDNIDKLNPLVSVFDVCMKDGNVTGFVVNNEALNQLKYDCVEKSVQTEEIKNSDLVQPYNMSDSEDKDYIELTSDGTYITHEYIHKYNIDKYMCRPCFPKYIEVLSKKTGIDVLQMFTNIYNERAMLKMTTTQNDKEGNTRILYITNPRKMPQNVDMNKHEIGHCLKEILVLKEKVRVLEMKNLKLETMKKSLGDHVRNYNYDHLWHD